MRFSLRNILSKLPTGANGRTQPQVFLGAFGKHPGWDDHIDDIGLETEQLVAAKRMLYVQGIGGNIDAGTWESMDAAQRLDGFRHLFVWRLDGDVVIGRLWSSSDAKGRTRYPMVVCAQWSGLPLGWVIEKTLPLLDEIERRCTQTASASDVRFMVDDARLGLRRVLPEEPFSDSPMPGFKRSLGMIAGRPEMGQDQEGLLRILYQVEDEMAAWHEGAPAKAREGQARQIRVAGCSESPAAALRLWHDFMLGRLDPAAPVLLVLPIGQPWLDIIVGEPSRQHLYCIRASEKAIPLTSDVPYTLDSRFVSRMREFIAEMGGSARRPAGAPAQQTAAQQTAAQPVDAAASPAQPQVEAPATQTPPPAQQTAAQQTAAQQTAAQQTAAQQADAAAPPAQPQVGAPATQTPPAQSSPPAAQQPGQVESAAVLAAQPPAKGAVSRMLSALNALKSNKPKPPQ